jgi:Nif-specific regulatory protein
VFTYLVVTSGPLAGNVYLLDPAIDNTIGRDLDCVVVVSDSVCSRVHAVISQRDGNWRIKDGHSLNGTFVDDEQVPEADLFEGSRVRLGVTEFRFHQSEQPPTASSIEEWLVRETAVGDAVTSRADEQILPVAMALPDAERAKDLLLLYQLAIRLLGTSDPAQVARIALELLHERTGASCVGFLWIGDDGRLRPQMVFPSKSVELPELSESLNQLLIRERHAVWLGKQHHLQNEQALRPFEDGICVPLVSQRKAVGSMHAYLERGRFRQAHFDFSISLGNITAQALVRARNDLGMSHELRRMRESAGEVDEILGDSPVMVALKENIPRAAGAQGCVLICGESGTGKELVARGVHRAGPRADRPLIAVNCAALPLELMESQLFGHLAGAFPGADRDHLGYFQQADTGTLFLDEVGELTPGGQAKLLRVLEGHPFAPLGSAEEVQVDVRVIAATNQDLELAVRQRRFREDLLFRLRGIGLVVPPLRERGEDVGRLIDWFLDRFRRRHGKPGLELSAEARERLLGFRWPGNVRQLRNVLDSATALARGQQIAVADLPLGEGSGGEIDTVRIDDWEKRLIVEALARSGQNIPEASRLLGISRATLYRKIEEYGVAR